MKRVLLGATAAVFFVGTSIAATTPDPAELPGGLSGKNVIHDSASTFNGQTITNVLGNLNTSVEDAQTTANTGVTNAATAQSSADAAQTTASAAIPLAQKDAASGVAALGSDKSIAYTPSTTAGAAVNGGSDVLSPFQSSPVKSLEAFNPTDSALGRQFTLRGGHSQNDIAAMKSLCKTISGGDEGGVCYQFVNGTGPEYDYRSGSGDTDGVNVEMDTAANAPLDVIGGGVASADGVTYTVTFGSNYATVTPALSAKEKAIFRSRMSIFTNIANGMSSVESTDYSGSDNVDMPNYYFGYNAGLSDSSDGSSTKITLESYYYPGQSFPGSIQAQYIWRTITNPSPYPYPGKQTWTQTAYSAGSSGATSLTITGNISPPEASSDGYNACSRWTCLISGTGIASGTTVTNWASQSGNTVLTLSNALTGSVSTGATITFAVEDSSGGDNFAPGNMNGDSIDNKISGNTNYHSYTSPALFLGQSVKDFNEYHLQSDYQPKDNITRSHDNEYDFWMKGADHDGQLESRGFTLAWQGGYRLATGSWMMRLAGFNIQPTGLYVDGVMNGGMEFRSDTGLYAFKQVGKESSTIGTVTPSLMMGSVGSSSGYGQLGWLASEDGSANGSYHLGLTKSSDTLQYNVSPLCDTTEVQPSPSWSCSIGGQVVFDPAGYSGGIGLGVGLGSSYVSGVNVDTSGNTHASHDLDVAGAFKASGIGTFSQGTTIPSGKSYAIQSSSSTVYITSDTAANVSLVQGNGNVGGGLATATFSLSNLPTTSSTSNGTQVFCYDCVLNGAEGVPVYWHSSASKWLDSQNNTPVN